MIVEATFDPQTADCRLPTPSSVDPSGLSYAVRRLRDRIMVDHELNELKREFLAEADEKVREIESALNNGSDSDGLQRLAYLAHQLKGSGGSYGYASISADAAEIEKTAEKIAAGEASFDGARTALQRHVNNLRTRIAESSRELGAARA